MSESNTYKTCTTHQTDRIELRVLSEGQSLQLHFYLRLWRVEDTGLS